MFTRSLSACGPSRTRFGGKRVFDIVEQSKVATGQLRTDSSASSTQSASSGLANIPRALEVVEARASRNLRVQALRDRLNASAREKLVKATRPVVPSSPCFAENEERTRAISSTTTVVHIEAMSLNRAVEPAMVSTSAEPMVDPKDTSVDYEEVYATYGKIELLLEDDKLLKTLVVNHDLMGVYQQLRTATKGTLYTGALSRGKSCNAINVAKVEETKSKDKNEDAAMERRFRQLLNLKD